jgi:peptidoglycan/xylan/chitin deacetylase (PgdA/CDA1 family)
MPRSRSARSLAIGSADELRMIRVALRFDDPSATSPRALEEEVIASLERSGVAATFAVIPFSETPNGLVALDESNAAHLLAAHRRGAIEVALHGHSHGSHNGQGKLSEFAGLSIAVQSTLLREAIAHMRELFGATAARGFVPPWNSYDAATLAAIEGLGLDYISAGEWHAPDYRGPLVDVPRTCQLADLESAVDEARKYSRLAPPSVIVVLHHYDFAESGADGATLNMRVFIDKLAWLKQQADVLTMTVGEIVESRSTGASIWPTKRWLRKEHLPWRLRKRLPKYCLVDAPIWRLLLA